MTQKQETNLKEYKPLEAKVNTKQTPEVLDQPILILHQLNDS